MRKQCLFAFGCLVLGGCASITQKQTLSSFNNAMEKGDYVTASTMAVQHSGFNAKHGTVDDLLWGLQAGLTQAQLGQVDTSIAILDASENMMKDEDLEGVLSRSTSIMGSTLTNDAQLSYKQSHYDGVMLNTTKAWAFLAQNDYANARVELNRAEERQRRAVHYFEKQISNQQQAQSDEINAQIDQTLTAKETQIALQRAGFQMGKWEPYQGYVNPFTTYTFGLNYLIHGKSRSDYQRAIEAFERVDSLSPSPMVKKDLELARQLAAGNTNARNNKIWLVFENGQSSIKEEKRVDIPLFLVTNKANYTGMALPRLKARGAAYPEIRVNGESSTIVADMDRIIAAEFDKEFPTILSREISRMLVKLTAEVALNEQDELLGLAASLYSIATTSADVRSFSALPSQYHTAQVDKVGNSFTLEIGGQSHIIELDESANSHIVHVKAPVANVEPIINIINL
ncbi:hypothetical protein ST37_18800 [Vibrio sp. qd031]|nr:hypothetical protein ST37_18800 [Vibrio sp. qd031]